MKVNCLIICSSLLGSLLTFKADASLSSYNSNGAELVYSSVSNITWTGNGNLLGTIMMKNGFDSTVDAIIAASPVIYDIPNRFDGSWDNYDGFFGRPYSGVYTISHRDFSDSILGITNWFGAMAFANYLSSIEYGGSNQWRLPSAGTNQNIGFDHISEFGQLFYSELGGLENSSIPDTSIFTNEQIYSYWLNTEYTSSPDLAWLFNTHFGSIFNPYKTQEYYAWAVSPGLVGTAPIPGAIWLFGTVLLSWLGTSKLRSRLDQ